MTEQESQKQRRAGWSRLGLAAVLAGIVLVRWRLTGVALERDEGEYAYGGQLLLQGVAPYRYLYNMKLPGIYVVYAGILWLFGQSATGVHLGLLAANALSVVLLFLLAGRLFGGGAAVAAAACLAVLSLGRPVQGLFANAEHFVLPPALAAFVLLARPRPSGWRIFAAGLLLGVAFVVKQHGVFFVAWGGVAAVGAAWAGRGAKGRGAVLTPLALFAAGAVLPFAAVCVWMWAAGVFDRFWFWTVTYAREYAAPGGVTPAQALEAFVVRAGEIVRAGPGLILLAVAGLFVLAFAPMEQWRRRQAAGLCLASALAVCPGWYFRPHYFILLLPAVALLAAAAIDRLASAVTGGRYWGAALLVVAVASSLYPQRTYIFFAPPEQVVRETYWPNPFNEAVEIGRFLRTRARPGDRLAVIGSEPEIYFYSGLRSASGYIYMYPLMETHPYALTMQRDMIRRTEEAAPEFLIFVRNPYSWLQKSGSHLLVYDWYKRYKQGYERLGLVEISEKRSKYSWREPLPWPPATPYWIEILGRRAGN